MPTISKVVVTYSDGTTQELDYVAPVTPTQVIEVTAGDTVEIIAK